MPISRDLFDQDIDDFDQRLITFLQRSQNQAYSLTELMSQLGIYVSSAADEASFIQRLDDLEHAGFIESKNIHGTLYFSAV